MYTYLSILVIKTMEIICYVRSYLHAYKIYLKLAGAQKFMHGAA